MATPGENLSIQPRWLSNFLSVFFNLLYHQFAWTYDLVSWIVSWGQWQSWIMTPLPRLGGGRILELGFGTGRFQVPAANAGKKIYGLDLSPQMAAIAMKRIANSGQQPNLAIGDGRRLPYADQCFDQIVSTFPTEYIFSSEALTEIHRVLSTKGELVLVPIAWMARDGVIYRFLSWLFLVTGQSVKRSSEKFEAFKNHYNQAGFSIEWETIEFDHSETLLVLARKEKKLEV